MLSELGWRSFPVLQTELALKCIIFFFNEVSVPAWSELDWDLDGNNAIVFPILSPNACTKEDSVSLHKLVGWSQTLSNPVLAPKGSGYKHVPLCPKFPN